MKGFLMVKETYIYNELEKLLAPECDRKEKLNKVASWIERKYGIKLCFCELLGKRWSYYAGSERFLVPQERVKINNNWGVLAENIEDKDKWERIVSALQRFSF